MDQNMIFELIMGFGAGKFFDAGYNFVKEKIFKRRKKTYVDDVILHNKQSNASIGTGYIFTCDTGSDLQLDSLLRDGTLPDLIRSAVAEPSLERLSELINNGRFTHALSDAQQQLNAIDVALKEHPGPNNIYVDAFRSYRQRLFFAAASVASFKGDIDAGREFWWNARELGPIDPEYHKQAAITLFNVKLIDELRYFAHQLDENSSVYRQVVAPCLAFINQEWAVVDKLLSDADSSDKILLRVYSLLQIIDFQDTESVKLIANLVDLTDEDTDFPVVNLMRAQLTIDLLKQVICEYTPLDYDRSSLIGKVVSRIDLALNTADVDSPYHAQALICLNIAGKLLRDDELSQRFKSEMEALSESIRTSVFFAYDSQLSIAKIDQFLANGEITITQSAILKSEIFQTLGKSEKIIYELYKALYASENIQERADVLHILIEYLRQEGRTNEIRTLIKSTPLRPADRWILRSIYIYRGELSSSWIDEVRVFPLDLEVIEYLVQISLAKLQLSFPDDHSSDQGDLNQAEECVHWTGKLLKILPSRSSKLYHAYALLCARRYDELLAFIQELDPIFSEQVAEFEAWALLGLDQISHAIDCFIIASQQYPESTRFLVNAARLLLIDHHPEKATDLLAPLIDSSTQDPEALVYYALSVHNQTPSSCEKASIAFDVLVKAYQILPNSKIATLAWQIAKVAEREHEARDFFARMIEEMPIKVINNKQDFYDVLKSENHGVLIEGEMNEYLKEMMEESNKRSNVLGELLHAHALSYVDYFRYSGQSWELWTQWTNQYKKRDSTGESSGSMPHIFSEFPNNYPDNICQKSSKCTKFFLDTTAILTLGVLGQDTAEEILITLGRSYIHKDLLRELNTDLRRISGKLRAGGASSYQKAYLFCNQNPEAIIRYSEDVESFIPNIPNLGARRADIGTSVMMDGLYVTDLDNHYEWSEDFKKITISSASVLSSLNELGEISADEARDMANRYPNVFGGWKSKNPRTIPDVLILDEYSLLDWVRSGLVNKLRNRFKVGPWAWLCVSEEAEHHQNMEIAYERLNDIIKLLKELIINKTLIEIEATTNPNFLKCNYDDQNQEESLILRKFWSCALESLHVAQSNGLQLWADDMFYTLLLQFGGPRNLGVEVNSIHQSFDDWPNSMPPISTVELLRQLSKSDRINSHLAEEVVTKLYSCGYRIAHPLIFSYALRQYRLPASNTLTPPFQKLINEIKEIPQYFNELFGVLYGNRNGYIRIASTRVTRQLIIDVWQKRKLTNQQQSVLADALIHAIADVFKSIKLENSQTQPHLSSFSYWQDIAYSLQTMQINQDSKLESSISALEWLGQVAVPYTKKHSMILWILEDNVLDSLKYALKSIEDYGNIDTLRKIISFFVVRAFIPLINANFSESLDPVLRRTVSMLARFPGNGYVTQYYYHNPNQEGTRLEISEEENEREAVQLLNLITSGDLRYTKFIWGTDLVFGYSRPIPEEWIDEGIPEDEQISVNVCYSLFSLLWNCSLNLRESLILLLIHQLAPIDPNLAYHFLLAKNDLLSEDTEKFMEARDKLGIELLRSGFFDLRRNLVHAVLRIRQYDYEFFSQFQGGIGEEASHELSNHISAPHVWQFGEFLVPIEHFIARTFLIDQFDDVSLIIYQIEKLVHDDKEIKNVDNLRLRDWIEDKVVTAENANDPFVAAWALRAVLLALPNTRTYHEINLNDQKVKVYDWVKNYMASALNPNITQPSELEKKMIDRRKLASFALLIATFICSGPRLFQAFHDQDGDSVAIFLTHVWLMADKLKVALVAQKGGLENAVEVAAHSVQKLEIKPSIDSNIDAFDPFAFGPTGDDIGTSLTLYAILTVLRQLPDNFDNTNWLTDTIIRQIQDLSDSESGKHISNGKESDNRFGLVISLRTHTIAQQLLKYVV
ncbi:MAG: hypothetical protein OXE59_11945 [Bacteroidetes bacterium]|nr:hypothetical protein [Bacteroidota bacterium]